MHFMVDIETMGVDMKNHDIIQIGFLECKKNSDGYYIPGRSYQRTLWTEQKPDSDWIAKNHAELLPICYKTEYASPTEIRAGILNFFLECGVNGRAPLMGLNAATFDIPFLVEKGYLIPSGYDKSGKATGDFHYRIYELRGAIEFAKDLYHFKDDKELLKIADNVGESISDFALPVGKKHEALFDCYKQLKTLNGLIGLGHGFQSNARGC